MAFGNVVNVQSSKPQMPRTIVTSDGKIDDECTVVRFLSHANEWDVERIAATRLQCHLLGYLWTGDKWITRYFKVFEKVFPYPVKHNPEFPTPEFLWERTKMGPTETQFT